MAIIEVKSLTKSFKDKKAVKSIDFQLEKGKCVALLGPNGAGKTTTLRMMSGLLKPTTGTIHIANAKKGEDIRHDIGYLPQYPVFYPWMTGKEFLVYVGQLAYLTKQEAAERADQLLQKVGISDAGNQRIGKYSGGMQQRLGIAQAMIHKPQVLLMDEPVSSLDPIGRREVLTLMEELKQQTTLLFSTHILGDAEEVCDDLLLMHQGEIMESGSIESLQHEHQATKFELAFQGDVTLYQQKLEQTPSVQSTFIEKGELHVMVGNIDLARKEILAAAVAEDWPLEKLALSRTTLEDLFMKVVNN